MVSNFSNKSISTSILHTQASPGKLSESSLVQTPHLCLQDLLPTSACESSHLPTSLCLSPDKLSEFSLVQTPHLCLQDSLPTSACRDILKHFTKTCRFRQSIDKSHPSNDLTANMPKSETKHTSSESRILKLFDALDFTSAMYQPSVDCKSLVSAQHRPSAKNPGAQYKRSQLHLRWCP